MESFVVLLLVACLFAVAVNCNRAPVRPFFLKTTTPRPIRNDSYYQKFQAIPPKATTAKKIVTNFLGLSPGALTKRSIVEHDIVAVLDSSGSIGPCEFRKGRRAIRNTMKITTAGHSFNYSGVVYSSIARRLFNFMPGPKAAEKIDVTPYLRAGTNTAAGLLKAKELFLDPNSGVRPFARYKRVFLVTDGKSNEDRHLTVPRAKELKNIGIKIFVVAVGSFKNDLPALVEMTEVASSPSEAYLFRVASYSEFGDIVKLAIKQIGLDYVKVVGNVPPPC